MSDLIPLVVVENEPRVDSRLIASQLGIEHQNARELIQDYQADFEEFGIIRFETGLIKGRGKPERFVLLNEDQAYLLLTYTKNTPQARELKKRLVHSFAEHRKAAIAGPQPQNAVLAAQLAELLQGKVLVDYKTLAELTRTVWAMGLLFKEVEPLTLKLQQQCGKPLIQDLLEMMPPAPAVPDYQVILETILNEIDQGKYHFPFAFREIDGMPCLVVRTMHLMAHLRHTPRLRPLFDRLELKSDRVLKRTLRQAGLLVRLRFDPIINDARLPHAVAIHIAGIRRQQNLEGSATGRIITHD